jgi:hypothetical protein
MAMRTTQLHAELWHRLNDVGDATNSGALFGRQRHRLCLQRLNAGKHGNVRVLVLRQDGAAMLLSP